MLRRFRFEKHQLTLHTQADVDEFEALLTGLNPVDRLQVKTISVEAADEFVKTFQKRQAHAGAFNSMAFAAVQQHREIGINEELQRAGVNPETAQVSQVENDPNFVATERVDTKALSDNLANIATKVVAAKAAKK